MIDDGYLTETPEGILSNAKPLTDEIEKELSQKNIVLTKSEKNELFNFLDTAFRQFVVIKKPYPKGDINAYEFLTFRLGHLVYVKMTSNFAKKHENSLPIPLSHVMEAMMNELSKDEAEYVKKAKIKIDEIQLSDELLQKLKVFIPEEFKVFPPILDLFFKPEKLKKKKR